METEIQENNISNDVDEKIIDAGDELKRKRIELGLDERQVADQLKLPIEQIRALESNDFGHFRSQTFARGFLKNYIRLVQLDEAPLLNAFDKLIKQEEAVITPINKNGKQAQLADPVVILVSIVIIVLLAFLAFWWPTMMQDTDLSLSDEDTRNSVVIEQVEDADLTEVAKRALASEILQAELGTPASDVVDSSDLSNNVVTGLSAETIALLKDAGVDPDAIEVPTKPIPVIEEPIELEQGSDQPFYAHDLVIEYIIDCWTEVRDSKGEILFSGVKEAGSTLILTFDGTYNIVLGYTPGVKSVVFKGSAIDITPYTRQNLARLELK